MRNKSVKKLIILTVNDCNRGLTPIFEALCHNKTITTYRFALNVIGSESILFLKKLLLSNKKLKTFDLRHEKTGVTHPLIKGKALNKKGENFALNIL